MKVHTSSIGMLSVCITLLLLAGCTTASRSKEEQPQGLTYRVDANSLVLSNRIRVLEKSGERKAGLLKIGVRAQNISEKDIKLQYRFVWIDKNGAVTEIPTSEWKMLHVKVKERVLMEGTALSADATDFLLSLRSLGD